MKTRAVFAQIIHQMSKFLKPYVDWLLSNKKRFQILFFCMVTVDIFFIATRLSAKVSRLFSKATRVFFAKVSRTRNRAKNVMFTLTKNELNRQS